MSEPYEPLGPTFYDANSGRTLKLVEEGSWSGWLCYKHTDGQWVSLRKATADDLKRIEEAVQQDMRTLSFTVPLRSRPYFVMKGE